MLHHRGHRRDNPNVRPVIARLGSELRSRWRAWVGAALLIGFGGGIVLTTAAGARRTATAYDRFLRASHAADLLVSPDGTGFPGLYAQLARTTHAEVTPVIGFGAAPVAHPGQGMLIVASPDPRWVTSVERPKITAGRMFRPDDPHEVVADVTAARAMHLHVGSRLDLAVASRDEEIPDPARDKRVDVRVVGIGVTRDSVVTVNSLASAPTFGAGPAFAAQFGENNYAFDGAYVTLPRGVSKPAFTAEAQAVARPLRYTGGNLSVADESQQAAQVDHAIRPQAVALALFSLLTAITALLAIGQVLSRALVLGAGDNDTLSAMGMTRRQLFAIGLAEVGVVTAAGAILAVIAAVACSPLMPIGPARIAEPHPGVAFDWTVFLVGVVSIVALFVAAMAVPAWRLARRGDERVGAGDRLARRPSRATRWATAAGTPPDAAIGIGYAVESGRGRAAVPTRGVIAVTALAVAAIAATATFGLNLSRLVNTPRLYGQSWDVTVDAGFGTLPTTRVQAVLAHQPGVTEWTFGTHADVTAGGKVIPGIALLATGRTPVSPTVVAGRSTTGPDEIALGGRTLTALHRRVGQTVTVRLPNPGMQTPPARELRIVGRSVFPFFGQGSFTPTGLGVGAEIAESALAAHAHVPVNFVLVRIAPGNRRAANIAAVEAALRRTHTCTADNQCTVSTRSRPTDVLNYARITSTPVALAAVLALLAIGVLANLLVSSIRRRRHDIAILKTLGFRRRQVSAAVAWQATTVVGLALLVGLPVGVALGRWVWSTFATNLGIPVEPRTPVAIVLLMIPVSLVVGNLVAAIPGVIASRRPPARALRSE
jgi:ABC-type antimicrobial peptide transport system permease subunit